MFLMFSPAPQTAVPPQPAMQSPAEAFALAQRRLDELDRLRTIGMKQAETLSSTVAMLSDSPEARYRAMTGGKGTIREFERLNRAIRQIVVLEFEIRGLFKAPERKDAKLKLGMIRFDRENLFDDLYERDDLDDYDDLDDLGDLDGLFSPGKGIGHINDLSDLRIRMDYSKDPVERLIADIRGVLGVAAPENDPFAPPARPRAPAEAKPMSHDAALLEKAAELRRRLMALKRPPGMVPRVAGQAEPVSKAAPAKAAKAAAALPRKGFRIPPTSPHNPATPPGAKRKRNRGPPRKRR